MLYMDLRITILIHHSHPAVQSPASLAGRAGVYRLYLAAADLTIHLRIITRGETSAAVILTA